MKKFLFLVSIMLTGVVHTMNAQNVTDYSLEGIGKTLSKLASNSSNITIGEFHEGLAWICVEQGDSRKYGYIDKLGNIVIPIIYSSADNFSEGLASVLQKPSYNGGKYGFIDRNGHVVIPFSIDGKVGRFSEGLVSVKKGKKISYIDRFGKVQIELESESMGSDFDFDFHDNIAPIPTGKGFETYFINKEGQIAIPTKQIMCTGFAYGFFIIVSKDGMGIMDTKGKFLISPNQEYTGIRGFSDGIFVFDNGFGHVSYVDVNGNEVIPSDYSAALPFSEDFAAVKKEDKWGYINKQGELMIPFQFKKAYSFHNGYAIVISENGYTTIDKQGNIVMPYVNNNIVVFGEFNESLTRILQDGKWGYADVYGNSTFNPKANPSMTATQSSQASDNYSAQTINSSFKGGETAMKRFISSTLKYPVVAVENGEQGSVIVGFTVEADGNLSNIHIEKSVSASLDKEAKRIVSNMPKWQPAQSGGISVKSTQTVEVSFRL